MTRSPSLPLLMTKWFMDDTLEHCVKWYLFQWSGIVMIGCIYKDIQLRWIYYSLNKFICCWSLFNDKHCASLEPLLIFKSQSAGTCLRFKNAGTRLEMNIEVFGQLELSAQYALLYVESRDQFWWSLHLRNAYDEVHQKCRLYDTIFYFSWIKLLWLPAKIFS